MITVGDFSVVTTIRFSREFAPYIRERIWAPNQRLTEDEADGSLILEMETSGWLDVKRWVMSYGMHAEVLKPQEMRKEMAEELTSSLGRYDPAHTVIRQGSGRGTAYVLRERAVDAEIIR